MKLPRETSAWKDTGGWLAYKDRKIFITRQGKGATKLLCLHAFPTSSFDYSKIIPALSSEFEFILFDYIGYGFSDKPKKHVYSLFEFADIAEFVAKHFGLEDLHILAHDIGDSVALELLNRSHLKISKLMLLNGSVWSIPFTDWGMLIPQRLTLNRFTGPWISRLGLFNRSALQRFFNRIFYLPPSSNEIDSFWSTVAYNNGARNYHLLMHYMHERWKHQKTWLNTLKSHSAKLGAVWGMNDPVATPAVLDALLNYRPDIISTRLEKTGHYPHWENPAATADAISSFFQS